VALLYLGTRAGGFDAALMGQAALALSPGTQATLFLAFALAFAVKVPLFPLHTWLPDAHTEAPTAGSVLLAGILLKLGSYGFLRFAIPILPGPAIHFARALAVLSVVAIVYGALVAMAQKDLKRMVAYSSVSHMGFIMLGLASMTLLGTQGAMLQMLNHGVSTGALFLLVGMLYDRTHSREIAAYGGLATRMPRFACLFLVVTLSSIALPLTNGFTGEFMILLGTYTSGFAWGPALACTATLGTLLGAVYMLRTTKRIFLGPLPEGSASAQVHDDLNGREMAVFLPIVVLIFWMGLHPQTFLGHSTGAVRRTLAWAQAPQPRPVPEVRP
jgi:NADH-quinone oxidoreductase subunit M